MESVPFSQLVTEPADIALGDARQEELASGTQSEKGSSGISLCAERVPRKIRAAGAGRKVLILWRAWRNSNPKASDP